MSLKKKLTSVSEGNTFRSWMKKYHGLNISEDTINIKDYEVQFAARWQAVSELLKKLQAELIRDGFTEVGDKIKIAFDKMTEAGNDVTSLIAQAVKDLPQENPKTEEPKEEPTQMTGDAVPIVPQNNIPGGNVNV